jgi:hypothetical protein
MSLFRLDIGRTPLREVANQTEPNPSPPVIGRRQSQTTASSDLPPSTGLEVPIHHRRRDSAAVGDDVVVRERPATYVNGRGRRWRERRRRVEGSYGEVADHLLREPDLGSREEAVGPLLGELAGLTEDDRNGREPDLAIGDPVGHDAGPDVVDLEDPRVTLFDDGCSADRSMGRAMLTVGDEHAPCDG